MSSDDTLAFAKKYVEDILSFFEVNADVEVTQQDDIIYVNVPANERNSLLIGRNAETLRSIQYMLSTTLRNQGAPIDRVNVDIAGYKKQREEKVAEQAKGWIEGVRKSGDSYIAHINAADRRIVHQVASEYDDITTFSEGEGRDRRIVIAQKSS